MDAQNKKLEVFNRARQCKLDEEDNNLIFPGGMYIMGTIGRPVINNRY